MIEEGDTVQVDVFCEPNENGNKEAPQTPILVESAIKTNIDIFVFNVPLMLSILFVKQSPLVNNNELMGLW